MPGNLWKARTYTCIEFAKQQSDKIRPKTFPQQRKKKNLNINATKNINSFVICKNNKHITGILIQNTNIHRHLLKLKQNRVPLAVDTSTSELVEYYI